MKIRVYLLGNVAVGKLINSDVRETIPAKKIEKIIGNLHK
jgi:hypothetical protein